MIVKMKKAYVVMQAKDMDEGLERLRELGAVHVEHQVDIPDGALNYLKEDVSQMQRVLDVLKPHADVAQKASSSWEDKAQELVAHLEEIESLEEAISRRQIRIDRWQKWGDFDPEDIKYLQEQGIYLKLFEIPINQLDKVPSDLIVREIYRESGVARCAVLAQAEFELSFDEIDLPQTSLSLKQQRNKRDAKQLAEIHEEIKKSAQYYEHLHKELHVREEALQFSEVKAGIGTEEILVYLKGYVPEGKAALLQKGAADHGWGLLLDDPADDDAVPTLLKCSSFGNLSKPAFDMIEVLPGYREFDVSSVFVIFFTLFFAILIGDAAYGLIFFLLTLFFQIKLKDKVKDKKVFHLLYLLTVATMIWGILTGIYFGQQWLPSQIKPIFPWLNDAQNIQWVCFTIAVVHLSIARIWKAISKFPCSTFLGEVGWLFIVIGMYYLANMFVIGRPMPSFALWLLGGGAALALFFMVPFKEFAKKVPQEIIPFVLGIISAGTDIISYIRLFAVGLATVAVADAANAMPEALPGVGYGLMVFLHVLNLILAAMAILVHAIRLNVLEFSGHLGLEWGGFKYHPFARKN